MRINTFGLFYFHDWHLQYENGILSRRLVTIWITLIPNKCHAVTTFFIASFLFVSWGSCRSYNGTGSALPLNNLKVTRQFSCEKSFLNHNFERENISEVAWGSRNMVPARRKHGRNTCYILCVCAFFYYSLLCIGILLWLYRELHMLLYYWILLLT